MCVVYIFYNKGQVINIGMTVKTIHILDKTLEISSEPNYDRLGQFTRDYPPLWAILTELIATGEIPDIVVPKVASIGRQIVL
jgi:hypothetical protein